MGPPDRHRGRALPNHGARGVTGAAGLTSTATHPTSSWRCAKPRRLARLSRHLGGARPRCWQEPAARKLTAPSSQRLRCSYASGRGPAQDAPRLPRTSSELGKGIEVRHSAPNTAHQPRQPRSRAHHDPSVDGALTHCLVTVSVGAEVVHASSAGSMKGSQSARRCLSPAGSIWSDW